MLVETKLLKSDLKQKPLILDSGSKLDYVQIAYQTYGELNSSRDNVILICHALTGNSHAAGKLRGFEYNPNANPDLLNRYSQLYKDKSGWWDELIGEGKVFDTKKYFIICSNTLGSCYGTTGPTSLNGENTYRMNFPKITVRDMVKVQKILIEYLGIKKILAAVGGSLGGMQVFEWALSFPDLVETIIPIASPVQHSPWAIALNRLAKEAIMKDPKWNLGNYIEQPTNGLSIARQAAMISYRSHESFQQRFARNKTQEQGKFLVESFLDHHSEKLLERFDANTYIYLSEAMNNFDLSNDRGNIVDVLRSIKQKSLITGISSDILYPTTELKSYLKFISKAEYAEINSIHGHDAFLIEFGQLEKIIGQFFINNFS